MLCLLEVLYMLFARDALLNWDALLLEVFYLHEMLGVLCLIAWGVCVLEVLCLHKVVCLDAVLANCNWWLCLQEALYLHKVLYLPKVLYLHEMLYLDELLMQQKHSTPQASRCCYATNWTLNCNLSRNPQFWIALCRKSYCIFWEKRLGLIVN